MSRKNGLILRILSLLALIETEENQTVIEQIRGLLNALRD